LYKRQKPYHAEEIERLAERLIWYADNWHMILSYSEQYIAAHNLTKNVSMRRTTWQV